MTNPVVMAPQHSRIWPEVLGVLVIVGMLVLFYQAVITSMQQGELHRIAVASQAEATWHCNTLSATQASQNCRMLITSAKVAPLAEPQRLAQAR
jgi:hypothetical protein